MKQPLFTSLLICVALFQVIDAKLFGLFRKKEYTPLVFFKVPKGTSAECKIDSIHCLFQRMSNAEKNFI